VPSPTFTYQWQRNGSDISGATSAAYTLQISDESQTIRCVVTASNAGGSASANSGTISPTAPTSTTYPTEVAADSPVGYWRLKDLTDSGPNGFTLTDSGVTITDAASLITNDASGGCKQFPSDAAQSLSHADNTSLRLTNSFSVEAWISPAIVPAVYNFVQCPAHYQVGMDSSGKIKATLFNSPGNFWEVVSTTTMTTGATYHVVVTFDGANARMYVNGTLETTTSSITGSPNSTAGSFSIGKNVDGAGTGWNGKIDEVAVYQSVLNGTRIAAHHTAGTA